MSDRTIQTDEMDDAAQLYVVAGTDLRAHADRWLAEIAEGDPREHPLLRHLADPDDEDQTFAGSMYMRSRIAPDLVGERGSREDLLLFAVVTAYSVSPDESQRPFPGYRAHLEFLLRRFHDLGEVEVARRLRQMGDERVNRARSTGDGAIEAARRAQEWGVFLRRELRAAEALDPGGDPWEQMVR
jgi:hypothetical protein